VSTRERGVGRGEGGQGVKALIGAKPLIWVGLFFSVGRRVGDLSFPRHGWLLFFDGAQRDISSSPRPPGLRNAPLSFHSSSCIDLWRRAAGSAPRGRCVLELVRVREGLKKVT
jgi:hypothetical protein